MHPHLVVRVALFLALLAGLGCGSSTGTVTGKVTFNGQPVTSGSVVFHGADGRVDSGLLDTQGNYTITRAPVGTVKVAVMAAKSSTKVVGGGAPPGPPAGKGKLKQGPDSTEKPIPATVEKSPIPERYYDPEKSGLVYTVTSGTQVIDIDLKP
jgi:hypothetical protein